MSRIGKSVETGSRVAAAGDLEEGAWGVAAHGHGVSEIRQWW